MLDNHAYVERTEKERYSWFRSVEAFCRLSRLRLFCTLPMYLSDIEKFTKYLSRARSSMFMYKYEWEGTYRESLSRKVEKEGIDLWGVAYYTRVN